ncbi:hypothetical protein [Bacillus phage SPO1L1]|nr:hypothetical protein [Bacillus phage SPO1L1]WIT26016.1 hypothetical protein [Bacillus phage SPO1L2]
MAINQYGVNFNGRRIVHPGAYGSIDDSAMTVTSDGSSNIPIVIGTADSGKSGEVLWYTGAEDARNELGGGDLPQALEMMFSPSPEGGGGASLVGVIVANKTVPATAAIGGVKFTAAEYGEGGNKIQVKLEDGSITGSKKFTAYKWDTQDMDTFDNIGPVMSVSYTGSAALAVIDVTITDGAATKIETKTGPDAENLTVDLQLDLTNERYSTVEAVAQYLNSVSDYSASYVNAMSLELESSKLDAVVGQDIKVKSYLTALKGDLEYRIGQYASLVDVEVTGNITNFDYTYLAGGEKGSTPTSWSDYLDLIKKQYSDILVVLTDSEAIHAEALAHVQQMENRKQRQMLFVGGGKGESPERAKERASLLNSSRAVLTYPGIYHSSYYSGSRELPAYFTAAMVAGRVAGVSQSTPVTFNKFNLVSLGRDMLAGDPEIDELITSGVCTLEKIKNGAIRLVQGITTYIGSNNTLLREISVRRTADLVATSVEQTLEDTFVGKKGVSTTVSSVQTVVGDALDQKVRSEDILGYGNIQVTFKNTMIYVDYEVAVVEPMNFILVRSHFVPDSGQFTTEEV